MSKNDKRGLTAIPPVPLGVPSDDMELDDVLPPEAFENLDMSISQDTQDEVMGTELYNHKTSYLTTETARKAARDAGDHSRAEPLAKQSAYHRMMAARISYYWPKAKQIAEEIAHVQTLRVKAERRSAIQAADRTEERYAK